MKNISIFLFILISFTCQAQIMTKNKIKAYPQTVEGDTKENYHGTTVRDPYRWLENDTADQTKEWVTAQNAVTFDYLAKIPFREAIKNKLTKLWNYEKFSAPFKEGNAYYFFRNSGLQNQSVLYSQENLNADPSVFLDPNELSKEARQ